MPADPLTTLSHDYKVPGGLKKSLLLWGLDSAVASQKARGAVVVVEGLFAAMKLHRPVLSRWWP